MLKRILIVLAGLALLAAGFIARPMVMPVEPIVVTVSKPSDCLPDPAKFKEGAKEAARYMRSKERLDCYGEAWPAATKVAKAIIAGKFGSTEKYDEWKKDLKEGYSGWGGIQTEDRTHYAWVYWQKGGTADLKKGVKGFSIGAVHMERGDDEDPYSILLMDEDGKGHLISLATFGAPDMPHYQLPATVGQLIALDRQALDRLAVELKMADL